ncbi:MAG TPA: Bax inhibitor-1/YccA family protein [Thermoanaerobaculia bacterium]|nr:Bax inhibitor-1/YccA family protein [Thermoanaerobaculia bacterium]
MLNPNVPPQSPGWISSSGAEVQAQVQAFIRSAYGWMFGGLALTALAAMWVWLSPAMQQIVFGTPGVALALIVVELGLVIWLSFRIQKMSPATAASAFLVYSLLNGLTLSVILFVYTSGSIFQAFFTASAMFGAMSVYGMVTRRDLTSWGSFFFMGLIGVIIAAVINLFLRSPALDFAISLIAVFVFVGLTAYDTQKLKRYAVMAPPDLVTNFAVIGALALYLDFINLFLALLRLTGSRR